MSTLRTLPEALADAARAEAGYVFVSGETDDATFPDLAVASGVGIVKAGEPARAERMAK